MKNSSNNKIENELSCTRRRIGSLILDYFIWYFMYAIMVIIFYLNNYGTPKVSGDLMYYKNAFDRVIKTPLFIDIYVGIICLWEIVIPIITNGQSLTKKIFKIKVVSENNLKINLLIRSIIKIIILNPYGVIAYMSGDLLNGQYINTISNILTVVFVISIVLVFRNNKSIHDKVAKTSVKLI